MTAPIDDVSTLPGRKISDQEEVPIGEVKEIYAMEGDGQPMWVSVEASSGMKKRRVFIPLARLKEEDGELRVPYSKDHINDTPEVDGSDGISKECDRKLRDHYGIDRGDQELWADNKSYATMVPEEAGAAERVEDPEKLETPDPDKRTEETKERLHDPGAAETRDVDAGAIADQNASNSKGGDGKQSGQGESEDQRSGKGNDGGQDEKREDQT